MSETALLWVLGSINAANLVVMGAIAKALFDHVKECRETRSELAAHNERVKAAEHEIESLRMAKHEHAGFLTQHELRIENMERNARGVR